MKVISNLERENEKLVGEASLAHSNDKDQQLSSKEMECHVLAEEKESLSAKLEAALKEKTALEAQVKELQAAPTPNKSRCKCSGDLETARATLKKLVEEKSKLEAADKAWKEEKAKLVQEKIKAGQEKNKANADLKNALNAHKSIKGIVLMSKKQIA